MLAARRATAHGECRKDAEVIDEIPMAYKDIDAVMAAQSDLVEVIYTQRHDIMQKRSEPDYYRHLEQARMVGHDIREWLDTPVKQHELVRRLQHDVAREHGFDMRDRVSRQNRTEPERVKSPSRGFSMGF